MSELLKKVQGCERIEKNKISSWLQADDSELELTDQEIVDMVKEPSAPEEAYKTDSETTHDDTRQVTADDAFNAFEVRFLLTSRYQFASFIFTSTVNNSQLMYLALAFFYFFCYNSKLQCWMLFHVALRFVEQSDDATSTDFLLINRWRNKAARKQCTEKT